MFCTTGIGKIAMVRQLEPALFVDCEEDSLQAIEPHVPIAAISLLNYKKLKESTIIAPTFQELFS